MDLNEIVKSQYLAALEMLKSAVTQCPDLLWDDASYRNRFWHTAFHALFYAHFYLQPKEEDFVPWEKHHANATSLAESANKLEAMKRPFTPAEILEYLAFVQQEVLHTVDKLDWDAESGFYWLPFSKLELQFYSIRHIQQHTGELFERLGARGRVDVHWVGKKPDYLA